MLYDRTDFSETIHFEKIDGLRECIVCHYWYLFRIHFRLQTCLSKFLKKSINFDDFFICIACIRSMGNRSVLRVGCHIKNVGSSVSRRTKVSTTKIFIYLFKTIKIYNAKIGRSWFDASAKFSLPVRLKIKF